VVDPPLPQSAASTATPPVAITEATPPAEASSDAADAASTGGLGTLLAEQDQLALRLARLQDRDGGADFAYQRAKAAVWLRYSRAALGAGDGSLAAHQALATATALVVSLEQKLPVPADSIARHWPALQSQAQALAAAPGFACATAEVAEFAVAAAWAEANVADPGAAAEWAARAEQLGNAAALAVANCAAAPVARPPALVTPAPSTITLAGDLVFAFGRAELSAAGGVRLDQVAAELKTYRIVESVIVAGHTDRLGRAAANQVLSERRAETVRRALIERGVPPTVITAVGYGATRPIATCAETLAPTALRQCLQADRRVEITLKVVR
jgi:outer membrane protein OmpA-like peptidoglycan-associated protein